MKTSKELHRIIKDSIKFPDGILNPEQIINFRGFFPICNGTKDGSDDLSKLKVMIVGQDFGKVKDYARAVLASVRGTRNESNTSPRFVAHETNQTLSLGSCPHETTSLR